MRIGGYEPGTRVRLFNRNLVFRARLSLNRTKIIPDVLSDVIERLKGANSALAVDSAAQIVDELRTNLSNQKEA